MFNDIGGYIELEIKNKNKEYHKKAIALNSARSALAYTIKANDIKEMNVPLYNCPLIWETVEKAGCKIKFYNIDENLMPENEFNEDEYILYVNYFGICSENTKKLSKKYKNLIIDNAQSFYSKPLGIASIYSPRKFFGVPDGGYLYTNKKLSEKFEQDKDSVNRFSHLIKRIEGGANWGYEDFNKNEESLDNTGIKTMSNLTKTLLGGVLTI